MPTDNKTNIIRLTTGRQLGRHAYPTEPESAGFAIRPCGALVVILQVWESAAGGGGCLAIEPQFTVGAIPVGEPAQRNDCTYGDGSLRRQ
jgi:hypothetical protein